MWKFELYSAKMVKKSKALLGREWTQMIFQHPHFCSSWLFSTNFYFHSQGDQITDSLWNKYILFSQLLLLILLITMFNF